MIDISLNLNETTLYPGESTGRRRDFLTPIDGEPGNFLLVVDSTATEKIIRCPTAGRYYLYEGREGHAKNAALVFGGAIHEGLELFYLGRSIDEQVAAIYKYFVDNPTPPDEYRTPQLAVQVLSHYREQCLIRVDYHDTTLTDGPQSSYPIIERPFEIPLGVLNIDAPIKLPQWETSQHANQIHVAWSGRIDRVVSNQPYNRIQDHKTTSIGGDQYIQSFQLSPQTLGYVWAARQMWPDLDIRGFQLNAIYQKKPSGTNGLMNKGPRGGEPSLSFFRANYDYTPERLDEWAHNMLTIIEDFCHCLVRGFFPMYTNHCFNKFGRCPYFDVDTIDNPDIRLRMLHSDAFKNVTWDPTA